MSRRPFPIDKVLYEILTECPGRMFKLHALRVEYSSRLAEGSLPPSNIELFWSIYMKLFAMEMAKLVGSRETKDGGSAFFLESAFWDQPFEIIDGLFLTG